MIKVRSGFEAPTIIFHGGLDAPQHELKGGESLEIDGSLSVYSESINGRKRSMKLKDFKKGIYYYLSQTGGKFARASIEVNTLIFTCVSPRLVNIVNESNSSLTVVVLNGNDTVTEVIPAGSFVVRDILDVYTNKGRLVSYDKIENDELKTTIDGITYKRNDTSLWVGIE